METELREGYVLDLATSKPVDIRKPEEPVRQEYEKALYEDYDYDYEQMDIEVTIQRGEKHSNKNKTEKADIVIFYTKDKNKRSQYKDILGVIETKRPTRKEGIRQLTSYMSATSCLWGVWTNGKEIEYLYKNTKTGEIKRNLVYQIPKNGESFEDIGKISKDKLKPAKNLKLIFSRLLNTLYSNTNISRREKLGNEMIRLIFCKIWDEKYNTGSLPKFRIGFEEKPNVVLKKIKELFKEVKEELSTDGVFDKNEKINLDAKSIAYVVGELEYFSLLKTDKDVVGDAFEVFAESKLVGEKGEFFTPREVVKIAIELTKPQPNHLVLDPACGSGGFLIYALEHIWGIMDNSKKYKGMKNLDIEKRNIAEKHLFGIDKEIDLVKIAKAYMAIIGDGRAGVVQQNSLHLAEDFEGKARDLFVDEDNKFKQFDIILTNPPFGSKTKVLKDDAQYFDLGHKWKKKDDCFIITDKPADTSIQELFIERCLKLLKNGGKLAIVLPETYFHSPNSKYIIQYIKQNNNIKAIIDLPHNTFRPHCNAKTLLLFLEKGVSQQKKVVFAVAEEMGHNHQGKPIYRYDKNTNKFTEELWDDTIIIRKELNSPDDIKNKYVFTIDFKNIKNNNFVPRYYWNNRVEEIEELAKKGNLDLISINDLIEDKIITFFDGHGSPPAQYKGMGEYPYIRVKDIVNWEVYKDPTAKIPEVIYKQKKGDKKNLKEKDILYVRRGSYRIGSVAMVSPYDKDVLLTREILVLRISKEINKYNLTPYYLLYLLSHKIVSMQTTTKVLIETTLPNIADRWKELRLPISQKIDERKRISEKIKSVIENKWQAVEGVETLKKELGDITT